MPAFIAEYLRYRQFSKIAIESSIVASSIIDRGHYQRHIAISHAAHGAFASRRAPCLPHYRGNCAASDDFSCGMSVKRHAAMPSFIIALPPPAMTNAMSAKAARLFQSRDEDDNAVRFQEYFKMSLILLPRHNMMPFIARFTALVDNSRRGAHASRCR